MSGMEKASNSDELVDIGESHQKAGRLQDAESYYRKALEIDAGHPGALYYLGSIAYEDGRLQFSTQLIEELLRGEPNDVEARHLLGMIALKEEDPARASEHFKKALVLQPSYALAYYSLGTALSKQRDFDAALTNFQRAVALNPTFAQAHCLIGNIFRAQNKLEEAISSYRRALNLQADFEPAIESIGGLLLSRGSSDEAITIFRKAIDTNPASAAAHAWLGAAHSSKDQNEIAVAFYERAIALDPCCFDALFNLGSALLKLGKTREAVIFYRRAVALNGKDTRLLTNLANALYVLGEIDGAVEVYRQLLAQEPNNPVAHHHLAAYTRDAMPERAADTYVEYTFDAFAESFDVTLKGLNYCGPQLMADALQREYGGPHKQLAVLDAGCGTGLCGPLIVAYAAQLTGVDLSAGMLAKAKLRNVYDELVKAELTAYLQSKTNAFDVILSADTLLYFGALENLLAAARTAMRDGGHLFFTVEMLSSEDVGSNSESGYYLNPHGRYSHSEAYLRRTLGTAGFTIIAMETVTLRHERGQPVQSFAVSCRAASDG